ncbi:MFS transporter [Halovulum dunhuangense]|uniref:MFS transporter n=1 Tax=Halovulum dunhuangense TaxID=1505036 RepID=A0A849L5Y0_9RHOB|nr:MFS transporter [Halovulum dunhuangense]NNU81776.1 MFS transporter [Halovulum dunhuangense]
MTNQIQARRTIVFVNAAHAFDHFVILIYPTAVIAMAPELGLSYAALIGLATGTFLAFGLFSLPMGWLSGRLGRRNMLAAFFLGSGISLLGLATAATPLVLGAWLLVLGVFAAIYHPVGTAMLVSNARKLGRDLGWNGVWGNLGAGLASGVTAFVAAWFGWRAAFAVPGVVLLAMGATFLLMVEDDRANAHTRKNDVPTIPVTRPRLLIGLFALALLAGGFTFNMTTIALPKVIDEKLGLDLPLTLVGTLATMTFLFGALTQLLMGRLIDRHPLPAIFVGLSFVQMTGLVVASLSTGVALMVGLALAMVGTYGQVTIKDAIVARYVPAERRATAYSIRYFVGSSVSGLAAPLIAFTYGFGGFPVVLGVTACFGIAIFVSAILFRWAATPPRPQLATA